MLTGTSLATPGIPSVAGAGVRPWTSVGADRGVSSGTIAVSQRAMVDGWEIKKIKKIKIKIKIKNYARRRRKKEKRKRKEKRRRRRNTSTRGPATRKPRVAAAREGSWASVSAGGIGGAIIQTVRAIVDHYDFHHYH